VIGVLARALLSQLLLAGFGLGVLQLLSRRRVGLSLLPWAWGVGVVALYVVGQVYVRGELLPGRWHPIVAGLMAGGFAAGILRWLRLAPPEPAAAPAPRWRWFDVALAGLIVIKIGMVAYVSTHDPVFDADATLANGYAPLAKQIGEGVSARDALAPAHGVAISPWGPPILLAWVRLFLDRWHDSVAGLPWLIAFVSIIGMAIVTARDITRNRTVALACGYAFSAIPLLATHAIRIGYNDLLTAYFVTMGLSVATRAFLATTGPGAPWIAVAAAAVAGSALSKLEGRMWAAWLLLMGLGLALHRLRGMRWRTILMLQAAGLALAFVAYQVLAARLLASSAGDRLSFLVPHGYEPGAAATTLSFLFGWGSFSIWGWLCALLTGSLLAWRVPAASRALALYSAGMVLGVVYVANFTGSVQFTAEGSNLGRFLLQVTGVLLPLGCAYAAEAVTPVAAPPAPGPQRRAARR